MSDLSGLQQSFGLSSVGMGSLGDEAPSFPSFSVTTEVQPHEVSFRPVRGPHEIARILHLREEIQLPATALADPGFAAREKKEMRSAASAHFCVTAKR